MIEGAINTYTYHSKNFCVDASPEIVARVTILVPGARLSARAYSIRDRSDLTAHDVARARTGVNATRIIRSIHLYLARSFVPSRARHVVDAKKRAPERGCLGCRDVARDDRTARRRADAGDDGDARTSGREASAVSGPGRGRTVERGEINARKEEKIQLRRRRPATKDVETRSWARRERCR